MFIEIRLHDLARPDLCFQTLDGPCKLDGEKLGQEDRAELVYIKQRTSFFDWAVLFESPKQEASAVVQLTIRC